MFSNVNRLPDRVPGGFSAILVRPTAKGACAPDKVIISMPRLVGSAKALCFNHYSVTVPLWDAQISAKGSERIAKVFQKLGI